jgi:rSAM/selenodomain-associated transferase 1
MAKPVVILFARAPRLGQVKRRLAAGIGPVAALRFYRNQLSRMLRELATLKNFDITVALTPRHAKLRSPKHLTVMTQSHGDLGARMHAAFNRYRNRPVILIGSDIPGLNHRHIRAAAKALNSHHAAFGPAADGGYYLIAMGPHRPANPFANVRWSSPTALADTLVNFRAQRIATLETLHDIDTANDFKTYASCALRRTPQCRYTRSRGGLGPE